MNLKETKMAELEAQIEALRTMPEGALMGDGTGRKMTERRRARYVAEGTACLEAARAKPDRWFDVMARQNLLFSDALI